MSFEIEVNAGSSVKLPTAGKYCDRDIVVTATGDSGGYDEGYADGVAKVEESNAAILTDCNAVLPDKGVEPAETLEQVPQRIGEIQSYDEGYDVGLEDGKQAEYDRFWDAVQQNGERTDYQYAFAYDSWNDETFKPKYDIRLVKGTRIFASAKITDLKGILEKQGVKLDFSNIDQFTTPFEWSKITRLPIIDLSRKMTQATAIFNYANNLQYIEKLILPEDGSLVVEFALCNALEHLRIEGVIGQSLNLSSASKLTNESVQSIIDHLKDLTGTTALTLTFHATVGAKLTQTQKDAISAKNWTLVY